MIPISSVKNKKDVLVEQITDVVGAGRPVAMETVDFSDSSRPKTCLEVDFPIIPLNQVASVEGSSGATRKPIYQVSKWWARRNSSVFRAMLLAASIKAPEDENQAAKAVWDVYYANHQIKGALRHLKIADPFMGGGTTIVEGSRLGPQMWGADLNPVAWFIVKNETADVNADDVRRLLEEIEAEVKPLIMPYFACDGPAGERGRWFRQNMMDGNPDAEYWDELPESFDIFSVPWAERRTYRYKGPEIIYTFWAKHGPCQRMGCGHRTPIMSTPVIAVKTLTVSAWLNQECGGPTGCGAVFDLEQHPTRMAPDAPFVISADEKPFATLGENGAYSCPKCGRRFADSLSAIRSGQLNGIRSKSKKVDLTLLMHPQWLDGCPARDSRGGPYGGSVTDDVESTIRWNNARAANLRLLEVRGILPEQVTCPETNVTFYTDARGGTAPLKTGKDGVTTGTRSAFACRADGSPNDNLTAILASGKSGASSAYVFHGYSAERRAAGAPYNGRFFAAVSNPARLNAAIKEWEHRKDRDLAGLWPESELPYGFMTHMNNGGIPNHGYSHWWKMFNPTQLLIHTQLLKAISTVGRYEDKVRDYVLCAFQQYLRNECMFTIWNLQADQLEPMFSNSNFHPKATTVENNVFGQYGRGNWRACAEGAMESLSWSLAPTEPLATTALENLNSDLAHKISGKSIKLLVGDRLTPSEIECCSATDLSSIANDSYDLIITDPPFGGLLHYSELSDYFYVWLRLVLNERFPAFFGPAYTPKTLEAVANRARQPNDPNGFYQRILTECWRESYRILKSGGLLAFTFHHSEDEPWVSVLESLFDAGFYLEATYPIRSDETKGEGAKPGTFGSQQIEYDIIHVCRKRLGNR